MRHNSKIALFFTSVLGLWFQQVDLNFLVPGHTKNECDGAFGCVKRMLKEQNVLCLADMFVEINESSVSAKDIAASEIEWMKWKAFL